MVGQSPEKTMSADELVIIGERVFGRWGWQRRMAVALDVNENTIRRWKAGQWPVNPLLVEHIRALRVPGTESCRLLLLRLALLTGENARAMQNTDGMMHLSALDGSWHAREECRQSIEDAMLLVSSRNGAQETDAR